MKAYNSNIPSFLGIPKTVFVVPVFQRNYDWKEENCRQLFIDIENVVRTGNEHFLGTICFKATNSRERLLIDGQQRLTSISLLLKTIYDFDSSEVVRVEIFDTYLYNNGLGVNNSSLRYKLRLNKNDDIVYHIILENKFNEVSSLLNESQKRSTIYKNYLLFHEMVEKYVNNNGSLANFLEAFYELTFVELDIENENPQEIFQSLNSTGLDLTDVDLLRNHLLMQFSYDKQTKLYEDYWERIEDNVGSENMVYFFIDYLIYKKHSDSVQVNGKRSHINEKTLFIAFTDYYHNILTEKDNYEKTLNCFQDMRYCSKLYKNFIFTNDVDLGKLSAIRKKLYYLLVVNEAIKCRSLLLYLYDLNAQGKIDDKTLDETVDGISSLTFRAKVCKAQGANRQFSGNIMMRFEKVQDYSNFIDDFWSAITSGKGSYAFPTDKEFKDALEQKGLYRFLRSKGIKYLLYMIETKSPFPKGLPPIDSDSMTIEHIMPQTLSSQWRSYLSKETIEQYDLLLDKIGNLSLTNYNPELSNKTFDEKKEIYKNSKYYYTTRICDYDKWQIDEINERSEKLAEIALQIWQLPKEYQFDMLSIPKYSLEEDSNRFTFTKPSCLYVGESEYKIDMWGQFLPVLCKHLNNEDHASFDALVKSKKIGVLVVQDENNNYSESGWHINIYEDVYIKSFMSAANTIATALKIAKEFDAVAGTDYAENVLFSLK